MAQALGVATEVAESIVARRPGVLLVDPSKMSQRVQRLSVMLNVTLAAAVEHAAVNPQIFFD